jgi:hypothetical protein
MDELMNQYTDALGENVAMYAIPSDIEIDGKVLTLEEFLQLCIKEKKLVTDYFPYKEDYDY